MKKKAKVLRVRCHRTVKPETVKLMAKLAEKLNTSEGRVIDQAIEALALKFETGK